MISPTSVSKINMESEQSQEKKGNTFLADMIEDEYESNPVK